MIIDDRHYKTSPEYPPFRDNQYGKVELVQADWDERNFNDPSYINNKPNVILSINGNKPDANGDLNISAVDIYKIGGIPNQAIGDACKAVLGL